MSMKRRALLKLLSSIWLVSQFSYGQTSTPVVKLGGGSYVPGIAEMQDGNEYQVGSEWSKKPVTEQELQKYPALRTIAYGTARIGGGTGFYLGKFAGKHVVATNHHVCPSAMSCGSSVSFPLLNKSFRVEKRYGSWTEIDLALVAIKVDAASEALMARYANPFNFNHQLQQGEPLATLGFGTAQNSARRLVGSWDSDCKVFSSDGEYRFMADPDQYNQGSYEAWSFANGCDCSHGDSGSAMVNRTTGRVVGIIWTGRIPKKPEIQDSTYLDELMQNGGDDIWTELSYAVPAAKMKQKFQSLLNSGEVQGELAGVVKEMLAN
jgi:S1-C subfamily serine protease